MARNTIISLKLVASLCCTLAHHIVGCHDMYQVLPGSTDQFPAPVIYVIAVGQS